MDGSRAKYTLLPALLHIMKCSLYGNVGEPAPDHNEMEIDHQGNIHAVAATSLQVVNINKCSQYFRIGNVRNK